MQVYRHMEIGTAKPPRELRERIPHHLIDICDPDEQYDVGRFVRDAEAAARAIVERGRLPVVSGGTAYYVKHLLTGLPAAPASDPEIREAIARELKTKGVAVMREMLAQVDPVSNNRIGAADAYRISRALEVYRQTGKPLSSFVPPRTIRGELDAEVLVLNRSREQLARRIEDRVDRMFSLGLYDEVLGLLDAGYSAADPGLRAIGYREFFDQAGKIRSRTDPQIRDDVVLDTRRYAKRQGTFLRSLPAADWIDADDISTIEKRIRVFSGRVSPP
jgi:tRNA dimethylallyltransferase